MNKILDLSKIHYPYCIANDTVRFAFVPIFKNASSWGKNYFSDCCNMTNVYDLRASEMPDMSYIIFLRDPITRWLSGIGTYFDNKHNGFNIGDKPILDMIFDAATFDVHTTPQTKFLRGIDLSKAYFFHADKNNFATSVRKFIVDKNLGDPIYRSPYNVTKSNTYKDDVIKIISHHLANNTTYQDKLNQKLYEDIEFMKDINFENIL